MLTPTDYPATTELPAMTPLPDALAASDVIPDNRGAGQARDQRSVPGDASSESHRLDHLRALEAESLHIIREVVAEFARPVMLYSIGKDSSVMLRLAQKAFYPAPIPFPLLHVDTTYKFREMINFRDRYARQVGARLIVHTNKEAIADGTQPFAVGTQRCCGLLKTKSLLDALESGGFDAAFGGARRDEERSRAKERIFRSAIRRDSGIRSTSGPSCGTSQRRNRQGESIRVFPLRIGPSSTSGTTSSPSRSPLCPLVLRPGARVVVRGESLLLREQEFRRSCRASAPSA